MTARQTQLCVYDDSPITHTDIFAEVSGGSITAQRPMELYGVGFRGGYTGYEFSAVTAGAPLLDEITHPFSASDGGYVAYPVIGDASQPGAYVDVSNSVTGGYSATATNHSTDAFTPSPWAIGTADLAPGAAIPNNTTFTFELDLAAPGVTGYVQQSLADGAIGFFLSSLHDTGELGAGGGYPRWYLRESTGFPYFSTMPPTLSIDYTLLSEAIPGDYDGSGVVDANDYSTWKATFGSSVTALSGADGNGNGTVDAADYIIWRKHFQRAETPLRGVPRPRRPRRPRRSRTGDRACDCLAARHQSCAIGRRRRGHDASSAAEHSPGPARLSSPQPP